MEASSGAGERRGRWGRSRGGGAPAPDSAAAEREEGCGADDSCAGALPSCAEAARGKEAESHGRVGQGEAASDRRWGGRGDARSAPSGGSRPPRVVYTLGTWRVSREFYLWQLQQRGVAQLVDVRGNPHSGREEELFRGRELTRALLGAGVRYEYWGDRLGEDQVEELSDHDLSLLLKGLLASAPPGPLCLFGHMHEPHKCHRLRLCDLLPAECAVEHLMWADHQELCSIGHGEARFKQDSSIRYFLQKRGEEEQKRKEERRRSAGGEGAHGGAPDPAEHESLAAAVAAAASAARLPTLVWQDVSAAEWEERLRDGRAYRLRLPWETELLWYPEFLGSEEAGRLEREVHDRITMYHPTYHFQTPSGLVQETINRKGQAKVCDDFTFTVQYSSRRDTAQLYNVERLEPWSQALLRRVEAASETVFNAIWFNHYRDGTVTIHWHTDSDEGLGPDPLIGSLSLGAARDFCFKSKRAWQPTKRGAGKLPSGGSGIVHIMVPLFHGSLIVMGRNSQRHWLHAVPAMEGIHRERTNLTFRFYAHEDLAVASGGKQGEGEEGGSGRLSNIRLRNSKLLREQGPARPEEAEERGADGSEGSGGSPAASPPERVRLVPKAGSAGLWSTGSTPYGLRSILIDAPDPRTTVGALVGRLRDSVLPEGIGRLCLAIRTSGGEGHRLLDDKSALSAELLCSTACSSSSSGQGEQYAELLLVQLPGTDSAASSSKPGLQGRQAEDGAPERASPSASKPKAAPSWPGMLVPCGGGGGPAEDAAACRFLERELDAAPPGPYAPPHRAQGLVETPHDKECWIREVLQSLSGIQRKSKGRGRLQQFVFHQSSEFAALYAGRPKSTVHLALVPKRLLRRCDARAEDAPLLRRLALYAAHLAQHLSVQRPGLLFAAGLRLRSGSAQQLHGHLLSMDLAAPGAGDLERRHFEDFAGGPGRFLPLHRAADMLASGRTLPAAPPDAGISQLVCHRCGQRFGDLMLQLAQHLTRCEAWPSAQRADAGLRDAGGEGALDAATRELLEECAGREVALLEEMGFGSCGRDALRAALVAEGSVERAVAVLAAQ